MARKTPPAGNHELGAALGLDVLEVLATGVVGVGAETVLLVVGAAEDRVANCGDAEDHCETLKAKFEGEHGEVAGLEVVDKGHPDKVTEGKHEAEAVHDDVHGGQKCRFHVETIQDVECLEDGDEDDRVCDVTVFPVLTSDVGEVQDNPSQQTGSHLIPDLDIDSPRAFADERDRQPHTRVQFASDEEVVQDVAGVSAGGQLSEFGVLLAW